MNNEKQIQKQTLTLVSVHTMFLISCIVSQIMLNKRTDMYLVYFLWAISISFTKKELSYSWK